MPIALIFLVSTGMDPKIWYFSVFSVPPWFNCILRMKRGAGAKANQVRIIGGIWRSRVLRFPAVDDLRPTPDRVRETLFNWLGQDLTGQTCLDLFAGSGALGFEATSRGAKSVVMIEHNAKAERALRENCSLLAGERIEIQRADALAFLRVDTRRFDVIFLDPPFQADLIPNVMPLLPDRLAPGGRVYLEADHLPDLSPGWQRLKHTRAGSVQGLLIEWRPT